jgi:DNA-binding response OmpR family regulator
MSAAKKIKTRNQEKFRVLVVEHDRPQARRLVDFLHQNGFETRSVAHVADTKQSLVTWKPHIVLADLLFPGLNAYELLRFIDGSPGLLRRKPVVLVTSPHDDPTNVAEAMQRGAKDFIVKPYLYQDLLNRVVLHCRDPREVKPFNEKEVAAHWYLVDLLLSQALEHQPLPQMLFHMVQMIAKKLDGNRCSVIRTTTLNDGLVVASSDDQSLSKWPLDLRKYPEVQLVINTQKTIAIENLSGSRALSKIQQELKSIHFNAMIVCPLQYRGKPFGVLSLRMPQTKKKLSEDDLHFADMAAKVLSLAVSAREVQEITPFGLVVA